MSSNGRFNKYLCVVLKRFYNALFRHLLISLTFIKIKKIFIGLSDALKRYRSQIQVFLFLNTHSYFIYETDIPMEVEVLSNFVYGDFEFYLTGT